MRIDLLDDSVELQLKEVRAISTFRDIPYKGSFRCNDERLNDIWQTGAYTVHLNMQEYPLGRDQTRPPGLGGRPASGSDGRKYCFRL